MAVLDLRPDITVRQIFETAAPTVPQTILPVALIGLNRQMVYRESAGVFVGGQPGQLYYFPGLIGGSVVEQPGAVLDVPEFPDVLEPHVYIQNEYGIGEVFSPHLTYDFVSTPPSFSIAPGASVTFTILESDSGTYSAVTDYFIDAEVDFIDVAVATGDEIDVLHSNGNYYKMFDVVDILSDDQLEVSRYNKAATPALPNALLSAEDAFGFRTLSESGQTFETKGVDAGDLVTVDAWDVLLGVHGGDYDVAGSGTGGANSRLFNDSTAKFLTSGPVAVGDVIFSSDAIGDWVPFFIVSGVAGMTETQIPDVENLVTLPSPNPALTQKGTGVPYAIYDMATLKGLNLGGAPFNSTTGQYGAQGATLDTHTPSNPTWRIFKDTTAAYSLVGPSPIAVGDAIVINYTGGAAPYLGPGNWPVFIVQNVLDATHLEVSQVDSTTPTGSVLAPSFVSYEIRNLTPRAGLANTAGSYSSEGFAPAPAGERVLDATGVNFATAGVAVGDYIRDMVTSRTLFRVTAVHPGAVVGRLFVKNIVPGNPPSGASNARFAFDVTDQNPAILQVVKVLDETSLSVKNTVAGTPTSNAHLGVLIASVTYPDSGTNINYKIKKTVSGSNLTGDVLCSYAARRNDYAGRRILIDELNFESILGHAVPGNDLALAAYFLFTILGKSAYAIQVPSDTDADWEDALDVAGSDQIYIPVVLTQRESVLALLRTHVDFMSRPEEKRERITFQCHKEVAQVTRTSATVGDSLTYNKTAAGVTTIVSTARDLTAYGVIAGDEFTGTLDDGVNQYPLSNIRIISIQASTPVAGQSTMRIVADPTIPAPSSGTVLGTWTIKSKTLSLLERANAQAAYAASIANRRIRNLWPDSGMFRFTDKTGGSSDVTGIFGGGDQIATLGGHFLTVIEAAKRSNENPRQPLTGLKRGTLYKLIDPMGDNQMYQDIILDGGNYYMLLDGEDQSPYALRAISTDTTDLYKLEDNVAVQVDSFARKIRAQLKPLLGPFVLDEPFFDLLSHNFEAVRIDVVEKNKEMKEIKLLSIKEKPDRPDTFVIKTRVWPYFSAAEGEVDIYI